MPRRLLALCLLLACDEPGPAPPPADPLAALAVVSDDPSDHPVAGLSAEWQRRFLAGDAAFDAIFDPADGLGPTWARRSCTGCHEGDARGPGMVRRVARTAPGYALGDLVRPFALPGRERPALPAEAATVDRLGPALFGRGWLEAIAPEAIERGARAQARGGEVSGRIARVPLAAATGAQRPFHDYAPGAADLIGRFGVKARHATLDDFVADAYLADMGLTSPLRPEELDGEDQREGVDLALGTVHSVADYVRLLAIPARGALDPDGRALFGAIGCASCHTPALPTRADYPIAPLAGTEAPVYTDLLLHDMGDALADGIAEHDATGDEWRTAPLIGLRHLRAYLHDGRAETIDQAIGAHGGEAAASARRFAALEDPERAALLRFLEAL